MFSMCSELTPRAHILDTRIPQLMQPCSHSTELMHIARLHLLCKLTAPGITWSDQAKLMSQALILSVRLSSHHSYKDKAAAEGRSTIDNDTFSTCTY